MLTHIHIKHFALVDELSLDFSPQFNVLTGETGAGKSIWIDAISFALGARADSQCIRHGKDKCAITVCFDLSQNALAREWLSAHDLDQEECIITRVIPRTGNARSTINGTPCALQQVREFSQQLLQIHGQHDQQHLLKSDSQRDLLDDYGDSHALCQQLASVYENWKLLEKDLQALEQQNQKRDSELSLLNYQLDELNTLALQENEWEQLNQEHQKLHSARSLLTQLDQALALTAQEGEISALQLIEQAREHLTQVRNPDSDVKNIQELLSTAIIHLKEASTEMHHYRDHVDLSPENLSRIENRLSKIHDLARKHHVNPEALLQTQASLEQQLADLNNLELKRDAIINKQKQLEREYQKRATTLSTRRKKGATKLSQAISAQLPALGMQGGVFQVALVEQPESGLSRHGNEAVVFELSANPGHPVQPLAKAASGGELSRISLALQVLRAKSQQTPTLIFDEVDTGIGGKTAAMVGQLLRTLGNNAQVLCITHLPQVASQGHHHYFVEKQPDKENVVSSHIQKLDEGARVQEIARMLGGAEITDQTLAHAKELLLA